MSQVPGPSNGDFFNLRARLMSRDDRFWRPKYQASTTSDEDSFASADGSFEEEDVFKDQVHTPQDQELVPEKEAQVCEQEVFTPVTPNHVDLPPDICPLCKKKFKSEHGVKIHIRMAHKTIVNQSVPDISRQRGTNPISNEKSQMTSSCLHAEHTSNVSLYHCTRCTGSQKSFNGRRGLRIHYARMHNDFMSDLDVLDSSSAVVPDDVQSFLAKLSYSKRNVRVLKRVPKGARIMVAQKLSQLVEKCLSNSLSSWMHLLIFSYVALQVPEKSKNLTQAVKVNVSRAEVSYVLPTTQTSKSKKNMSSGKTTLSRRVESKIADGDVRGAVKILSSSDSLAEENDQVYAQLKTKHPHPSRVLTFPDPPTSLNVGFEVTEKDVLEGIFSFPNGSSGGIDGLRPQHLRDLLSKSTGESGSKLLTTLTKLCNLMLSGNVNSGITPVLYGATITALNKKGGGIRPIAVGCTLRRLTSKLGCRFYRDDVAGYLNPIQLGFGTKGGCEGAIHATRTFINQNRNTEKIVLKIDFENAFNTVERDTLLSQVKEKTPYLYPFLWQCYSNPSVLFFGDKTIQSQVGLQQGDPAGPLGFSLAIHPVVQELKSDLNVWYLDDGTLAGDPETVLCDFKEVARKCKEFGLHVNTGKCELYFCKDVDPQVVEEFSQVSPGIQIVSALSLLGSPISDNCTKDLFEKKFAEISTLLERLSGLKCHIAYYVLKNCLSIPKLTYLLRTSPAWNLKQEIELMDSVIKNTLESIINTKLNDETWRKCSLPVKFGGVGIRQISESILPAFLSSVNSTFPLVCTMLNSITNLEDIAMYKEGLGKWKESFGDDSTPTGVNLQHEWDDIVCKGVVDQLPLITDEDKALHRAALCPESNGWLHVLPSNTLGTLLDDNTFRIAMALRLGAPICAPHTCVCGEFVNEKGTHGLSCAKSAGRFSRHSGLNDVIRRALSSAKIPAVLEPVGVMREDGKRPDGMSIIPWKNGKCMVWDATCTDTLAPSNIKLASKEAGSVAEMAASKKKNKYKNLVDQYIFVPMAVESMGPWCKEGRKFVQEVGSTLMEVTGEGRSLAYLRQRLSIVIQKGNAASVMGTVPCTVPMSEIFYL